MVGVGTPSAKQGNTATDRKANVWFDGPEIEEEKKKYIEYQKAQWVCSH